FDQDDEQTQRRLKSIQSDKAKGAP
ncbi:MAG: hypothetical protein K0Q84_2852, partial [Arthrobacter sp.]|nr:hypothetical protein [Arthrobacter sp.]